MKDSRRDSNGDYASKSLDHLRRLGYTERRILGEVWLWGTVVEHEEGWRAQFAYPRKFTVALSTVPLGMSRLELWLTSLSAYGCDIFIDRETGTVPLWRSESGIDTAGLGLQTPLKACCSSAYQKTICEKLVARMRWH